MRSIIDTTAAHSLNRAWFEEDRGTILGVSLRKNFIESCTRILASRRQGQGDLASHHSTRFQGSIMRILCSVGLLALSLMLTSGCADTTTPTEDCQSAADCQADESCVGGECVQPSVDCSSDADCAQGETCDVSAGLCIAPPAPDVCSGDDDCAEDEFCDLEGRKGSGDRRAGEPVASGLCSKKDDPPSGCTSDDDCEEGFECVIAQDEETGTCVEEPVFSGCKEDADCEENQACDIPDGADSGECVDVTKPGGCFSDADCKEGEICKFPNAEEAPGDGADMAPMGTCVPKAKPEGCTSDADCEEGEYCDFSTAEEKPNGVAPPEGVCKPKETPCLSDEDCDEDEYCDFGEMKAPPNGIQPPPAEGVCKPKKPEPTECFSDADCKEGEFCDFSSPEEIPNGVPVQNSGICKPKNPKPEGCFSDADCKEGEFCDFGAMNDDPDGDMAPQGTCKPNDPKPTECYSDADCPPDMECDFGDMDNPNQKPAAPAGQCVPKKPKPNECFSDKDCKMGEFCDFSNQDNADNALVPMPGVCKPKGGTPNACDTDDDCDLGEQCDDGPSDNKIPPPPQTPDMLCLNSGGNWTDCGSGCGPATCDNPSPGPACPDVCTIMCECPPQAPFWDDFMGCIPKDACGGPVGGGICVPIPCKDDKDCPDGTSCDFGPGDGADKKAEDPAPIAVGGICTPDDEPGCMATGCSSEVCASQPVNTLCMYEPWFDCLKLSMCGNYGPDGACGWEMNDAFNECLADKCGGDPMCGPGPIPQQP